ncbi:unnamed protein product [Closterium sp. NIES-53]
MFDTTGPAPSGVSQVDPLPGPAPVQVAVDSGAARGAVSGGAASGGAEPGGAESEGTETGGAEPGGVTTGGGELGVAEPEGVEPGGAASEDVESGGVERQGAASSGGSAGASPRLSPQQLREWFFRRASLRGGVSGAGGAVATGAGGAGVAAETGVPGGTATTSLGGARTRGTGAAGAGGVEVAEQETLWSLALLTLVALELEELELEALAQEALVLESQPPLQTASPLPAPSPYTELSGGLTECLEPASRSFSPVRIAQRVPRLRPPLVPGTHAMNIRPSSVPLRFPLPPPPESSLPEVPGHESDRARAASPTVARLLATAVTDPSFESAAASALVAELLGFAATCRLDYASDLVAESASACPPSVGGECALGTDVLEDRQEDFECLAAAVPRFASLLLAPEGDPNAPDIPPSLIRRGDYGSLLLSVAGSHGCQDGILEVHRHLRLRGSPTWGEHSRWHVDFQGFSQRQGVDYFQTFSPTPKMTTLWVLLHVAAQRDYELHSFDFSTAFLQGSLHEEIWLHRPPGFSGSFPPGTQWSLWRPDYVPPFYVLVYVDDLVFATADTEALTLVKSELQKRHTCTDLEPSGPYPELVGCLNYLMTCTRLDLAYPLSLLARYVAPDRHGNVHWDAAKRVLGYLCSTSCMGLLLGGRCPVVLTGHADASWAEIYAGAMAAQELRWLTYLLTDLGDQPRSPPKLYVDNKAMIALCHEHKLEHRTKHITLRDFLARELQQRGQLRLARI